MHHHKPKQVQPGAIDALHKLREFMLYDATATISVPAQQPAQQQQQQQQQQQPTQKPQQQQQQPTQKPQQQQQQPTQKPQPITDNAFRPAVNQDPLFWCFYVMQNGAFKYEQIANRFTAEQDGKRDQVLLLRTQIKALKQTTGIKITASTIEGEIMSPRISLHAFQVLVHLNSLNAVFVNPQNRVYAEFISDAVSDKPVYLMQRMDEKSRRVSMTQATEAQLTSLRETHYRIENLQKPIKSMSSHTVADLIEMCHRLKIQLKPKMKKQELYDSIVKQLVL